jgi:glycosyltransferase involved in cell wall biosynthesis
VITGYLQYLGPIRKFVPFLRALWFSHLDLSGYDVVITSSGAEAKGIKVDSNTIHINYCHAPTHYYWSRYDEYMKHPGFGFFDPLARLGLKLLVGPMRRWDYKAAQRPTFIIANSTHIQADIKKYYGRESVVIHPPVDTERFSHPSENRSGFVIAGRQTPYKRVDLAVLACTNLNLPLKVIGTGRDHARLLSMAGPSVSFITNASDVQVAEYFASAEAFVFPGVDDFGITPVEAMAAGTPVIAYQAGGALDYVEPGKTGEFFNEQSAVSLEKVLSTFSAAKYSQGDIKQAAQKFSKENFRKSLEAYITSVLQ